MKKLILLVALFTFALMPVTVRAQDNEKPLVVIIKLQDDINAVFSKLDADAARAAKELGKTGIEGEAAREVIRNLAASAGLYSVDSCAVNTKGIITIVEPPEYKKFEGSDISAQPQVLRLWATKQPVMGELFMSVEGFYASSIEHPVLSDKGELLGSVSLMFKPENIFALVLEEDLKGTPVHAWAMQKDGRLVYDSDPAQIGKILFEDPMYQPFPRLLTLCRKIAAARSGFGPYDFYDIGKKNIVTKDAVWATIGVNGTEWRLVAATKRFAVNDREDAQIKAATQAATGMLQILYDKSKKGDITLEQAQKDGADMLRALRYGDDRQGYFWADTIEGINVVLPVDRKVEQTNRMDANLKGVYYIHELIINGKQPGGGYTDYWFVKPGAAELSRKRGYTLLFEPFGWIVGTGYYPE